ncbi:MAG: anti-sigma factor [Proteobacteria bacterium SG_bin9]|nr:MAG: anti-sigma factor [Proteobacteria bacterium SG_bin9]
MAYSEDHIALAAEYVLGTLDADERTQVETMMSIDSGFRAVVEAWEIKLGGLNQMVDPIEPPAELWDRIKLAAGLSQPQLPLNLPEVNAPEIAAAPAAEAATARASATVIDFSNRLRRTRSFAQLATAMAASLAALVAVQAYRPDLLPQQLRPKPEVKIVEVVTPAPPAAAPAQFVAVLQKGADFPAFILTVDTATKNFVVRKVGAQPEAGKSYELWIVSDKLNAPRSLGVIGDDEFTKRAVLSSYDEDTINQATYAVTVEPEGGSPTGRATGPIVFTGKLIESVPPAK